MSKPFKRDWASLVIQFVPAILGSGVLITTISNYYAELGDNPIVRLTVFPDKKDYSKVSATLSNIGGGPATNLTARITTPYNIVNDDVFSLEEIEVQKINPKTLQMFMPRLIHGEGSVTTITLGMDKVVNYTENFQTYIVYDQGSNRGHIYQEFTIFNAFTDFISILITPIGIMILGVSITVGLLLFRQFIFKPYRIKRINKILGEFSSTVSYSLDKVFSAYSKGQKTIHETAYSLAKLEFYQVLFSKIWHEVDVQNFVDDKAVFEKHEAYFRLIIDDATRQLTTNRQYYQYFDDLKKNILQSELKETILKVQNWLWITDTVYYRRDPSTFKKDEEDKLMYNEPVDFTFGKKDFHISPREIEVEIGSSITTRLDNYLKAKTGIPQDG